MNRVLGILLLLGCLAGATWTVFQAAEATPPEPGQILAAFGDFVGESVDSYEKPILTDPRQVNGWRIWAGSHNKYSRTEPYEIHRERDPSDALRELRVYREPVSYGAKIRGLWLTLTGHESSP